MPTEKPRYTVIVDDELLQKIDDFRFENRYPSRSAATIDLIRLGMKALEELQKLGKQNEEDHNNKTKETIKIAARGGGIKEIELTEQEKQALIDAADQGKGKDKGDLF